MNHPPSQILAKHLWVGSIFTQPTTAGLWPIFHQNLPDQPVNAGVLYDTDGFADGRIMASGQKIVHPGIMCHVRAGTPGAAFLKLQTLADYLDTIRRASVEIEGTTYRIDNASRQGSPLYLGEEEEALCFRYSLNMILTITTLA